MLYFFNTLVQPTFLFFHVFFLGLNKNPNNKIISIHYISANLIKTLKNRTNNPSNKKKKKKHAEKLLIQTKFHNTNIKSHSYQKSTPLATYFFDEINF